MPKIDSSDKERLRMLCVNHLLYVFPSGEGYFRPSGIRFKRNGEVWGYRPLKGWQSMGGMGATGPRSSDRWTF